MSTFPKTLPHDALKFLFANHKAMLAMFRDYEQHKNGAIALDKGKAALRLCHRLSIHCTIKEEHFYPAVAAVLGKTVEAVLAEAEVQIGVLRGLMTTIEHQSSSEISFDPTMKVLADTARRHLEVEEEALFPMVRHAKFDLAGTGERLATRQAQLSTEPAGKADIREARRVLRG